VTDDEGCQGTDTATVVVNPNPTATAGGDEVCEGATINLSGSASGGTSPYTYSWSGPGGYSSSDQNPSIPSATTADAGTYTLTVTDDEGCQGTDTATVVVNPNPTVDAGPDQTFCPPDTIQLSATPSGGTPPYTYSWSGPGGYSSSDQNPTIPNSVEANAGTYTVIVTDAEGCQDTDTVTITMVCPTCSTAVAAQGPEESGQFQFEGSNWFTYINYGIGDGSDTVPVEYPIFTGQTFRIGTLEVYDDGTHVFVRYLAGDAPDGCDWVGFSSIHIEVVDEATPTYFPDILNKSYNPNPGKCTYKYAFADETTDTGFIELTEDDFSGGATNDDVYIFAHSIFCYFCE
jgi:hypothetical protein